MPHVDPQSEAANEAAERWWLSLSPNERFQYQADMLGTPFDTVFSYYWHVINPEGTPQPPPQPSNGGQMTNGNYDFGTRPFPYDVGGPTTTIDQLDAVEPQITAIAPALIPVFSLLGGAARAVGGYLLAKRLGGLVGDAYRFATGGVGGRALQVATGAEVLDLATPGIDLPSPSDIPGWVFSVMDMLFNFDGSRGTAFAVGQQYNPAQIVKTWNANGVSFARLADGRTLVQKKNGTVRSFRQPKPIVIYASGSSDLKTLMRAYKAVAKQLNSLNDMIKKAQQQAPRRRTRRAASAPAQPRAIPATFVVNQD